MSENWLHISPTSGVGSTQMTISADTNNTGAARKAKIVITAGTMTRTIDVVQSWVLDGDVVSTYQQTQSGVKILNQILNDIDKVVLQGNNKTIVFTGNSLNTLTSTTVYTFDSETPTAITAAVTFKNSFDGLTRGIYCDLPDLLTLSFNRKATSLYAVQHNPRLKYLYLSSDVTTFGLGMFDCPALEEIAGESPLIYNSRTLVSTGSTKSLCGFAPYGIEEYEIPNVVKEVYSHMFEFDVSSITITPLTIKTVNIPDSITGVNACLTTFSNFNSLETITLPETNAFGKIKEGMFSGCTSLKNFTVNSNVFEIDSNAFNGCSSITSITVNKASGITISADTFQGIATGGTLYHPEGSDYSSWLSDNQYYLGYYLWKDGVEFRIDNISTYFLLFTSGQTGTSNTQSVFINASRSDYQINVSSAQSQTASTQIDWLVVSGTPAAGNVEFKIYPTSSTTENRIAYVHIVHDGQIYGTITVQQQSIGASIVVNKNSLSFTSGATGSSCAQTITVTSNVVYTIENNNSWFTVSGTPATGQTTLSVYPNSTTSSDRNSVFTLKYNGTVYQTISVLQSSSAVTPTITVNMTSLSFTSGETGSSSAKTIIVNSNVVYTIEISDTWLTVNGAPATGSTTLTVYPVSANTGSTDKNATIEIKYNGTTYQTISVVQYSSGVTSYATPTPSSLSFTSGETGSSNAKTLTIESNVVYTIDNTASTWLSIVGTPATGVVQYSVYPTSTAATYRNVVINIMYNNSVLNSFTVSQDSAQTGDTRIRPQMNEITFSNYEIGSSKAKTIVVDSSVIYSVSSDWWIGTSGTTYSGTSHFYIYPTSFENNRTGSVYLKYNGVTCQTITVKQTSTAFIMGKVNYSAPAKGEEESLGFWAPDTSVTYSAVSSESWLSLAPITYTSYSAGGVMGHCWVNLSSNNTGLKRDATVSLYGNGVLCDTRTYSQNSLLLDYNFTVSSKTLDENTTVYLPSSDAGSITFTVTANEGYFAYLYDGNGFNPTCTNMGSNNSGTTSFTLTYSRNTGSSDRPLCWIIFYNQNDGDNGIPLANGNLMLYFLQPHA